MPSLTQSEISFTWTITKAASQPGSHVDKKRCIEKQDLVEEKLGSNAFDKLPLEINKIIASYLDHDRDVYRFQASCKAGFDAVMADGLSFWRTRFIATFDAGSWSAGAMNCQFRDVYKHRMGVLRDLQNVRFCLGETPQEKACLEVMRDMFIDTFTGLSHHNKSVAESLNVPLLRNTLSRNNILGIIGQTFDVKTGRRRSDKGLLMKPTALLCIIQVLFTPDILSLENQAYPAIGDIATTQQCVFGTTSKFPLFAHFGGSESEIELESLTRHLHFWQFHMTKHDEALFRSFSELQGHERPRYSSFPVSQTVFRPGRHWRGAYSYLDRMELLHQVRDGEGHWDRIAEGFEHEFESDAFQSFFMTITSDDYHPSNSHDNHHQDHDNEHGPKTEPFWPNLFDHHIPLHPFVTHARHRRTRRQIQEHQKLSNNDSWAAVSFNVCDDEADFQASGWIHSLPAQNDVPGWRRVIMMKYSLDSTGGIDHDSLWAYEGVMLPGDQIILGRWWSPMHGLDEGMYSGPFIWWCVDP